MTDNPPARARVLTGRDAEPLPWADVHARLAGAHSYWLATIAADGRPQARPVLGVWVDGAMHTTSSPDARKARNLAADGRCSLTVTTEDMDLVYEAVARRVVDRPSLDAVAAAYDAKYGWPVTVAGDAFDAPYGAPTAGPPPYEPWALDPIAVYAFATTEPRYDRATRFTF